MSKDKKIQVLLASFEAYPFMKVGGLGDVAGSLPKAINALHGKEPRAEVRTVIPDYSSIAGSYRKNMKEEFSFPCIFAGKEHRCTVNSLRHQGVQYYFLGDEIYLSGEKAYGYEDDGIRMAFFCEAVTVLLEYLQDFKVDIVHCNDWHTALIPLFLRGKGEKIGFYKNIKTVFTIHNMLFQGTFPKTYLTETLKLSEDMPDIETLICGDGINYMKSALKLADKITTVSPGYAREICTPEYGCSAEDILNSREKDLVGILNGIDTDKFSPAVGETETAARAKDMIKIKAAKKTIIQRERNLPERENVPILTLISRLTEQKGLDILIPAMETLLKEDIQFIVLGTGDEKYETAFSELAKKFPDKMSAEFAFSEEFSIKLYESADIILIPSKFEPCGLTQMIGMRYGTVPIVRATGGLKDSVKPYCREESGCTGTDGAGTGGTGTGFVFEEYDEKALTAAAEQAIALYYKDREEWNGIVKRCLAEDFSWEISAEKYRNLYCSII